MTQQQWEYTITLGFEGNTNHLNTMGKEGWELVNVANGNAYLKRPLVAPAVEAAPEFPTAPIFQVGDRVLWATAESNDTGTVTGVDRHGGLEIDWDDEGYGRYNAVQVRAHVVYGYLKHMPAPAAPAPKPPVLTVGQWVQWVNDPEPGLILGLTDNAITVLWSGVGRSSEYRPRPITYDDGDLGYTLKHLRPIPTPAALPLGIVPNGSLFATADGVLAVKSQYGSPTGQCQCVLLASGEYAHFEDGNNTLVRILPAPEVKL